jgi:uncharacterized DUF497 family protein
MVSDERFDSGEDRYLTLRLLFGFVVAISHTTDADGMIRLISARKAEKHEQETYFKNVWD